VHMKRYIERDLTQHRKQARAAVAKLSFEEKLIAFAGTAKEMEALGLPRFWIGGEAAHGIQARNDQAGELGTPAYTTVFPNPIGMAASWDKELMHDIGEVTGTEARSLFMEGKHGSLCVWAPTVDMERDPRWGRNEEAYGEDPHLASRMAGEYILGMAGEDPDYVRCGATLKHFYGNNVEQDRKVADSNINDKLKETYYIRVFQEIIEYAMPLAAMSSYNVVNGVASTVNPELRSLLKAWGLTHIVADAGALTYTVDPQKVAKDEAEGAAMAIKAGVDYFPDPVAGDNMHQREAVREAIRRGLMTEADLDASLVDKLTAYSILGLFDYETTKAQGIDLPRPPFTKEDYNLSKVDNAYNRSVARRAAAEAVVLLKNEGKVLPLKKEESVVLAGPFADRCPLDWYSGYTTKMVTLQEGMEKQGHIVAGEGLYPYVKIRLGDDYGGLSDGMLCRVEKEQAETFRIMLWDDKRITLRAVSNGKLLTTNRPEGFSAQDDILAAKDAPPIFAFPDESFSWFVNEAFELYDDRDETIRFTDENAACFWEDERIAGIRNRDGKLALTFETVKGAKEQVMQLPAADTVLACFGIHPLINCKEDIDRESIAFPPFMKAVLSELSEKYEKTVLLLSANAPLGIREQKENDRIAAILWACQGSEEFGNGVADILYGARTPASKLPQTWYETDEELGDINDYDIECKQITYLYMKNKPLYAFGYGLTYSDFKARIIKIEEQPDKDKAKSGIMAEVTVWIKNTGDVTSDEVIELYRDNEGRYYLWTDERPIECPLVAFERVRDLEPGQEKEVVLQVG
nr:glycoside hydrolase family 3 C-terminal domain-containing protein [Lachnospiraceae bacterium]